VSLVKFVDRKNWFSLRCATPRHVRLCCSRYISGKLFL